VCYLYGTQTSSLVCYDMTDILVIRYLKLVADPSP
jgi:hypothetical protein